MDSRSSSWAIGAAATHRPPQVQAGHDPEGQGGGGLSQVSGSDRPAIRPVTCGPSGCRQGLAARRDDQDLVRPVCLMFLGAPVLGGEAAHAPPPARATKGSTGRGVRNRTTSAAGNPREFRASAKSAFASKGMLEREAAAEAGAAVSPRKSVSPSGPAQVTASRPLRATGPVPNLDTPAPRMVRCGRRPNMAKKAATNRSGRPRRRIRAQSLVFTVLGLLVVASFVLSLIK